MNSSINYITIEDCYIKLFQLAIEFDLNEKTPPYQENLDAVKNLEGILLNVQNPNYYKSFAQKYAYLILAINKGHHFINGNKRLALIISIVFAYINGYKVKNSTKLVYKNWFKEYFPDYNFINKDFKKKYGTAFYNLNIAIASSDKSFDELKVILENFFETFFIK